MQETPKRRKGSKLLPASILLERIISGGQTGPDRAALDFARARGLAHGGWCPRGRWAEDGPIAARYVLAETPSADPSQRTKWNVRDSDGTVIFSIAARLTGGSKLTFEHARQHGKPCLHLSHERDGEHAVKKLASFLNEHRIKVLNVAGPRRSGEPQAGRFALATLQRYARTWSRAVKKSAPHTDRRKNQATQGSAR